MTEQLEERAKARIGTVIRGKYRIDRVLGMGGMAVVYKATHRNQAEFAIKMLHPELSLNADIRGRFLREGYAANSVKHPGAVRVVDDDVAEDGAAFLVMELLDGIPGDHLPAGATGRVGVDVACAVGLELLEVLAAAHAVGIVHRDIKPANVFLLRDGSIKVLDFGIARVRDTMSPDGGMHMTGTGMMLGTPAFMAPEQAMGKSSDIDARVDVWATGVTLFNLASGQNLHDAETAAQFLVKLATQQAQSLRAVLPEAPPPIAAVVDRAVMLDRALRWSSATAMRDALGAAAIEVYGAAFSARGLLASAVALQTGRPAPAAGGWTPVSHGSGSAGGSRTAPAPSHARGVAASSITGGVDTGPPVSSDSRVSRAAKKPVATIAVIGVSALALAAGAAVLVRGKASAPASTPAAVATAAAPVATGAPSAQPAPTPSSPAAPSPEQGTPETAAAAPVASPKAADPSRHDPPRPPAGAPHHAPLATASSVAAAAPLTAPPSGRPAPPAPAAAPAADPLDGRR